VIPEGEVSEKRGGMLLYLREGWGGRGQVEGERRSARQERAEKVGELVRERKGLDSTQQKERGGALVG
jgi:hypothetical protein